MPRIFFALMFIALLPLHTAMAEDVVEHENVSARLIVAAPESPEDAIVQINLDEGWHTYGDPPGDAGLAPRFDWSASENAKEINIILPPTTPKTEMDMFTVNSYAGEIIIPVTVEADKAQEDINLKTTLTLMICNEICIPETFELSAVLKAPAL